MQIKRIFSLVFLSVLMVPTKVDACTNFLIGKDASADGSTIVTYNVDSYGMYGRLPLYPAASYPQGQMRHIVFSDINKYMGEIAEAPQTYKVIGQMNEYQLSIVETTFGGRTELAGTGTIDYVSLMTIALQRARTAREAIKVMTSLVEEYGYGSTGETFSIADPDEIWIMELIGKGADDKGAVWVAVRIPDDCICAHANQSRIHQFDLKDKENVLYSKDVISFARKKGYFSGKDSDFSFSRAYSPSNFHMRRACEARAWSFYNKHVEGMERYLPWAEGWDENAEVMPLYFKPKHKLSLRDAMDGMRDHYEGTPFDMTVDCSGGAWDSPYRPRPQEFEVDGKKYFHERPIATQQSCCTMVCQMRSWMPDAVGGVLWFGNDDAAMVTYTPVYCGATRVPVCYDAPGATDLIFSWDSAFWVCNWVSNMTYPRYSRLFPDVERVREELQDKFIAGQAAVEEKALACCTTHLGDAVEQLTSFGEACASEMLERWKELGIYLIVKHNDMAVKPETDGKFDVTEYGRGVPPIRDGYNMNYQRTIVHDTGDKYLIKEN
ncbi:MAG: C69 family dipeptidase [Bacteroidales bacterium]|nr:C69 family dipeptidase [Bacteroidales bacterium]